MTIKRKCSYCGCIYGEFDAEGADTMGLDVSHGVCPSPVCQDKAMRDMGVLL